MTGQDRTRGGHVEGGLLGGAHLPLIARLLNAPFIAVIKAYQLTLSPILGRQCRFYPTCSWYGLEAYRTHGPIKGTWLTAVRILKCQPCHRGGYDPVPPGKPAG